MEGPRSREDHVLERTSSLLRTLEFEGFSREEAATGVLYAVAIEIFLSYDKASASDVVDLTTRTAMVTAKELKEAQGEDDSVAT